MADTDRDIEEDTENTLLPLIVGLLAAFTVGYWVLAGDPSQAANASGKSVPESTRLHAVL